MRDFAQLDAVRIVVKKPSDFVSSADLRSQGALWGELSLAYPGHGFLLEESPHDSRGTAGARFVIDPLDGTTNFLHAIPHFAVSIALEVEGDVVAGVVLNPATGELFWAEKGRGAFLGDRRLLVSQDRELSRCVVGTGIPHRGGRGHTEYLLALARIMPQVAGVRRLGAAALDLAYVAAGRFGIFFEQGLAPWDVAAGTLLVREAGGIVTKTDGSPLSLGDHDVLATSGEPLHSTAVAFLDPLHVASGNSA